MTRKRSSARDLLAVASFLVLFVVPIRALAGELIFAQSIDGRYLVTATATGDNNTSKSFVYSINAGGVAPPPPPPTSMALRSTAVTLSARLQNGVVTVTGTVSVKDQTGAAIAGAATAVTWTLPGGTKQNQTASTGGSGKVTFSATGGRAKYTLTVTDITKPGYTFDSAKSV